MPGGDRTGPFNAVPGSGRGRGRGQGNRPGSGPGGYCVCPNCNYKTSHTRGVPCNTIKCPQCSTMMIKA